ncbi:ADP compounds hydrolase nudE [Serratia plymuthica]|uniref:ADP compounds hydrolase nudE n=1 Tax=Serratia plymuthica TaxID=82996 RepID=A0A2X4VDG4_SERPL|nr:ADP compounds hydrolase nudE [Serratia plymuthica]
MDKHLQKPKILKVETVARSRLFNVESSIWSSVMVYGGCMNGCGLGKGSRYDCPVIGDDLLLIREYAVGTESYELGFPKGLIDPGEGVLEAANRELMEEVGFGAKRFDFLSQLTMAPSYFSSKMNIVLANDLYLQSLEGDEPEPLPQVRWPIADMMSLLAERISARRAMSVHCSSPRHFCAARARQQSPISVDKKGPDFSGPFPLEQLVAFAAGVRQRSAGIPRRVACR